MKKRHNLPQVDISPVNSIIETEQVAVTDKEETVRKGSMK